MFNNGNAITGLQFAPTSCEVVNVNNEDEVYQLWDSSEELMCDANTPHPVNFEVYQVPDTKQFYGLTYQGFAFDSVDGATGQQLLKCHVEICHDDTEDSVCQTGCFDSATTAEPTISATEFTTTTTSFLATAPLSGCDPSKISDSQYCYTIPDSYYVFDYYDENNEFYHGIEEIHVGAIITMSKVCASDYHHPGSWYVNEGTYGCDYYSDPNIYSHHNGQSKCQLSSIEDIITGLVHTPNGYISMFNCPQCGCTATDIIKMTDEIPRSASGGR